MSPGALPPSAAASDEISELIEVLHTTDQRLEELLAGEVDSVTDRAGHTMLLRRAQGDWRASEAAKQAAILSALPAHIALLDCQGVIVSVNEAWRRFGRGQARQAPGHEVGFNYLELCSGPGGVDSDDARKVAVGIRSVLTGDHKDFAIEYSCRGVEQERWFQLTVTPLSDRHPGGAVVMHVDITERRAAEDELRDLNVDLDARVRARTAEVNLARDDAEEANRAKSAFLAAMSHEIRTPMNGVLGMIEVLHETSLKADQVEMVDLICQSAFSLLKIIDDILDYSKIEAGKLLVDNQAMVLADTVESVCGMLDHLAVSQGVRMTVFVDPALPQVVLGDQGRLRQVLVNLAGNAIKFSSRRDQPGRVSVRLLLVEQGTQAVTVDLRVIDNGIGMGEAILARLFTPFSQADASTTRKFGGTGLGLAITGMLVRLMGGEISVASAVGQGATFSVRLRFAIGEAPDLVPGRVMPLEAMRWRIVGDEQPLGDDLAAYLMDAGALVERSADLAAAGAAEEGVGLRHWLLLPVEPVPVLGTLRAIAAGRSDAQTRFVLLGWGKRRRPRVETSDLVALDADTLLRPGFVGSAG